MTHPAAAGTAAQAAQAANFNLVEYGAWRTHGLLVRATQL
jgi:hypothetical protein